MSKVIKDIFEEYLTLNTQFSDEMVQFVKNKTLGINSSNNNNRFEIVTVAECKSNEKGEKIIYI